MDLARSRAGIKEQAKFMGSFAILMYDLQTDNLHKMKDHDQAVIREQMTTQNNKSTTTTKKQTATAAQAELKTNCTSFESVDSIRFLKTNVAFYQRAILVWIKYKMIHSERL